MSTTTANLGLFKYTNADKNLKFNINDALNPNWDKIDSKLVNTTTNQFIYSKKTFAIEGANPIQVRNTVTDGSTNTCVIEYAGVDNDTPNMWGILGYTRNKTLFSTVDNVSHNVLTNSTFGTATGSTSQPVYIDSNGVAQPCTTSFTDDTLMIQNKSTTNSTYPVLLCPTANASESQGAKTGIFCQDVKINPATATITTTASVPLNSTATTVNLRQNDNTYLRVTTVGALVLSTIQSNNLYFRPNGTDSSSGEMTLNSSGDLTLTGDLSIAGDTSITGSATVTGTMTANDLHTNNSSITLSNFNTNAVPNCMYVSKYQTKQKYTATTATISLHPAISIYTISPTTSTTFIIDTTNAELAAGFAFTWELYLDLKTNGVQTITWPNSIIWENNTAPSLTSAKTYMFVFRKLGSTSTIWYASCQGVWG